MADQSRSNFNLRYRTGLSDENYFIKDGQGVEQAVGIVRRAKRMKPLTNEEIDSNFLTLEDELRLRAPIDSPVFTGIANFDSNTAIIVPRGDSDDMPVDAVDGMLRYNTETHQFEGYQNGKWAQVGGGATGGGNDHIFYLSDKVVTSDYAIPEDKNAMAAGRITINNGVTVTVGVGSRLVIV